MDYIVTSATDVGIKKQINQDALFVRRIITPSQTVAFAILSDGVGGLQFGEIASAQIVDAFKGWLYDRLPILLANNEITDSCIRRQWGSIVEEQHSKLLHLGAERGCKIGATVTVLLVTAARYYVLNVGDSRAYELCGTNVKQLTKDHTVASREVSLGNMTVEQAEHSPVRSVLTRCVGAGDNAVPDMFFGTPACENVYLLCSDGFRHKVSEHEINAALNNMACRSSTELNERLWEIIELNKQRGETDNISALVIKCI